MLMYRLSKCGSDKGYGFTATRLTSRSHDPARIDIAGGVTDRHEAIHAPPASPAHDKIPPSKVDGISFSRQFWRLGVSPFAFTNSSELLLTELLLYNVGVGIER